MSNQNRAPTPSPPRAAGTGRRSSVPAPRTTPRPAGSGDAPRAPLLTGADVMRTLAISRKTLRRLRRDGLLPAVVLGPRTRP